MTKKEVLNDIIYDLKMKEHAYFEADNQSFEIERIAANAIYDYAKYLITGENDKQIPVKNLTIARKEISKLGKNLLWL